MLVNVRTNIDIDDVWADMTDEQKKRFVDEHIDEFDSDAMYDELASRDYLDR